MSRAKKAKETCMTNMLGVMCADGKVTEEEKLAFVAGCMTLGITEEEAMAHIESLPTKSFQFTRPKGELECLKNLFNCVMIMYADGHMHPEELETCRVYADALGIPRDIVSDMSEIVKKSR